MTSAVCYVMFATGAATPGEYDVNIPEAAIGMFNYSLSDSADRNEERQACFVTDFRQSCHLAFRLD